MLLLLKEVCVVITQEIYNKVKLYSSKVYSRKWDKQAVEDLTQDVILKLLAYNDEVECLSGFISTVVKHAYINKSKSDESKVAINTEYYDRMPQQYLTDTSRLVKQDFEKLLEYFSTRPSCKQILKLLIDSPDESYADLAAAHGIDTNTFKANVRHIREVLASVSTHY